MLSACCCACEQEKLRDPAEAERTVATQDDGRGGLQDLTLHEALSSAGLDSELEEAQRQLTIDRLNVAASQAMFHRFDNFNDTYNPLADPNLRAIFMKTRNKIQGEYFAQLMHTVFARMRDPSQDQLSTRLEPRLSIYGRSAQEWGQLAEWFVANRMLSCRPDGSTDDRVRWSIQIPRLYKVFASGERPAVESFGELLRNIFTPLFEVRSFDGNLGKFDGSFPIFWHI